MHVNKAWNYEYHNGGSSDKCHQRRRKNTNKMRTSSFTKRQKIKTFSFTLILCSLFFIHFQSLWRWRTGTVWTAMQSPDNLLGAFFSFFFLCIFECIFIVDANAAIEVSPKWSWRKGFAEAAAVSALLVWIYTFGLADDDDFHEAKLLSQGENLFSLGSNATQKQVVHDRGPTSVGALRALLTRWRWQQHDINGFPHVHAKPFTKVNFFCVLLFFCFFFFFLLVAQSFSSTFAAIFIFYTPTAHKHKQTAVALDEKEFFFIKSQRAMRKKKLRWTKAKKGHERNFNAMYLPQYMRMLLFLWGSLFLLQSSFRM